MLLFAQESMYWLTGYDTFGFCFFQCLVVKADGSMVLLTRSADLRQARHTSIIDNIVIATINREEGDTGVHTHTRMLSQGLSAANVRCARHRGA